MKGLGRTFWNRDERRLRALWRILAQTVLWFGVTVILILPVVILVSESDQVMAGGFHLEVAAQSVAAVVAVYLAGWWLDRRRSGEFGLRLDRRWWLDLAFGLLLGGVLITLIVLVGVAAGWMTVTETLVASGEASAASAIIASTIMFILIGVSEEAVIRGYHLTNIAEGLCGRRLGPRGAVVAAVIVTTLIFAAMHLFNDHAGLLAMIGVGMLGLATAAGYVLTGRLAIPIGLHITWNLFQDTIFGLPVSGGNLSEAAVVRIEPHGPALWVGDAFGPESGLLAIGALAVGIALIALWARLTTGAVRLDTSIAQPSESAARGAGLRV